MLRGWEGRRMLHVGSVTLTMTPFTHPKRTGSGMEALPGSPSASSSPASGPASGRPLLCCRSDTGVRRRPGSGCGMRGRQVRVDCRQPSLEAMLWLSTQLETAGFSDFSQGLLRDVQSAQHQSWHQEAGNTVTHHRHVAETSSMARGCRRCYGYSQAPLP